MRIAKGLEPYLKRIALATRVRRRGNRLAAPLDASRIATVMVYRPERYGDMLATLPVLRAMRAAFPHWRISVWTSPQGREVLQPEGLVDDIEIVNRKVTDRRIALGRPSFDLVLDLIQRDSVLTLWVCSAAARKGILAGFGKDELQPYYHWARALEPSDEYAMWRGMGLLELFGLPERRADLSLRYTADERAWAAGILATWPGPVILNLSAHDRVQRFWPEEKWAGLAAHFVERLPQAVLLNAIGPERECARRIAAAHPDRVFALPEGTRFRAVACLVSQSACFVSPDTSLMHVAGPAGVPTVGLYPLRYEFRWTWVPPGEHVRIVYSDVPRSFREIPLSAVSSAVDDLLASFPEVRGGEVAAATARPGTSRRPAGRAEEAAE